MFKISGAKAPIWQTHIIKTPWQQDTELRNWQKSHTKKAHRHWDHDVMRSRGRLKCDGTHEETRFRLSAKRTSPSKSAGASVQSTTGSRGVRICVSNAGFTMFRGSVKGTGYPFHSPVSPALPLPCVTVCHHVSTVLYDKKVHVDLYRVSSSTFWMEPDVCNIGKAELWNLCPLVDTRFIKNCQSDYIIRGHKFRTTHKKKL